MMELNKGFHIVGDIMNVVPASEFKNKETGEVKPTPQKLQVSWKDTNGKLKLIDISDKHGKFSEKDEGKKGVAFEVNIGSNNDRLWYSLK